MGMIKNALDDWISDNKSDLIKEFIKEHSEEYADFRNQYATDVASDDDFCEFEYEKFYDFCMESYNSSKDWEATKLSLWQR
jgi:hypothetical protein